MVNKDAQAPKVGMNRDSASFETSKEYYTFALNANVQDEHGSGRVIIQNEPSNILCTGFKTGYKVVGHKYDVRHERTYFFLTNPQTGFSEIGFISTFQEAIPLSPNETIVDGNIEVVLETPLEEVSQTFSCLYTTLISDDCQGLGSGCLNFSIFYPIKESNIHIKHGKRGTTLWWTDYNNPQRYINVDNISQYQTITNTCDDEETEICLDCNKLRVFPLFDKPCLTPKAVEFGGNLRAGIYEVLIGGSDEENNILTNLYAQTNPIPVFDRNNLVLDQTVLDYETNMAFSIEVEGFDKSYDYFTLVVLFRNGLDGALTQFKFGPYPNSRTTVTIDTLRGKEPIALVDVFNRRPTYTKAKGLATSNGYLYHYGLEQHREINLQPIVNLLGGFARWSTYMARETLYQEAEGVAKYKGYMRDEVYPYAIRLFSKGGFETAVFPLIARPPRDFELDLLGGDDYESNDETDSVLEFNRECGENARIYRWQFENTAEETDDCLIPSGSLDEEVVEREEQAACIVTDEEGIVVVDTIEFSEFYFDSPLNIVDYINSNQAAIIASTGDNGEDIRDIISDPTQYEVDCTPTFGSNCDEDIELHYEEIFAISAASQEVTQVTVIPTEDNITDAVIDCNANQLDENDQPINDTSFMITYMEVGETVYLKNSPPNQSCSNAIPVPLFSSPQHHNHKGEINGTSSLLTTKNVTATATELLITLTGSSGNCNIVIDGVSYTATFTTSLAQTATNFVTAHGADITLATGLDVTAVSGVIKLEGDFADFYSVGFVHGTGNLSGTYDGYHFSDKLHSNALWYYVPFNGFQNRLVEIIRNTYSSPMPNETNSLRISVFTSCGATSDIGAYSVIIDDMSNYTPDMFVDLNATDFGGVGATAYIAIDTPLRGRSQGLKETFTLTTLIGCFGLMLRESEYTYRITYTDLTFGKRQVYKTMCTYTIPILNSNCEAVPYKKGLFSYVESTETYPCNKELYDSSTLVIHPDDIPADYRDEFEAYYTEGTDIDGNYILSEQTDFRDKPIRHYKYPDNRIAPFMSEAGTAIGENEPSLIFPIGFHIPDGMVEAFLDIAVNNNLLTPTERNNITHYEIFRGDRRTQRTVIAKGLLFDMYNFQEENNGVNQQIHYSNFPLNPLGTDTYNNVPHPFNSTGNNFFTFHSPETHFEKPTLTGEIRVEGYLLGTANIEFDEVRDHPTYIILNQPAYNLATTLSIAEASFELALQIGSITQGTSVTSAAPIGVAVATMTVQSVFRVGELRLKWIRVLKNLGKPNQFAYFGVHRGFYNTFLPNNEPFQILRGISTKAYLKDGRFVVPDENNPGQVYRINNLDREYSVMLQLGRYNVNYPTQYSNLDNQIQGTQTSRVLYSGKGRSEIINRQTGAPYAAIKRYLPSQYRDISSITWLTTGFCGTLGFGDDCQAAFGGDVFISRFSLRRKFPHFTTNSMGQGPMTPFKYTDYFNVNRASGELETPFTFNHTFVDYEVNEDDMPAGAYIFPSDFTRHKLVPFPSNSGFYVKPPSKFYLFHYGIPHFLVESEINCNFRYAKREVNEDFYPNVQDVVEWNQETRMSIREPNTFFYNGVYSGTQSLVPYKTLPDTFSREVFDRINNLSNQVIYTRQDVSEAALFDPWLSHRASDAYNFSLSYGDLISLKGIEAVQLVALFENGFEIFGSVDLLADRLTPEIKNLGSGGIFAGRPASFNKTDNGHQGSQHNLMLSCEAGHFWVDAKRGKVFNLAAGGKQIKEVSRNEQGYNTGIEKWFKDQLPFKILRFFPNLDIDNNYNFVGLTMGWDDRLKRLFITKKDYTPKRRDIQYIEGIGFYILVGGEPQQVQLSDPNYFTDCSWTVGYNPFMGTWLSYYSFKPNYYGSYNNYFQTGVNNTVDNSEFGLWSHLPFVSSYQVFYGKKYPFVIEYPIQPRGANGHLQFIEYLLETRKYYDKYNYTDIVGVGFNKAYVYNTYQNTGLLELIHQQNNNPLQLINYPNYLPNSVEVLQTEIAGKWSVNHMYNAIDKEKQGLPIFLHDAANIDKTIDTRLVKQNKTFKDYLRGDYFLVRLINDKETRYKMLFRYGTDIRNFYEQ